jgi:hypothetical protein
MDEDKSRSGIFYTADGKPEVWFHGVYYGSVLPEEMIDEVVDSLKKINQKGEL